MHSRKAFSNIRSLQEGKLLSFVWAAESMFSHKLNKIIFSFEAVELLGALLRPKAWPNFQF